MSQNEPYPEFPDAAASMSVEEAGAPRRAVRRSPAGLAHASLILGLLGVADGLVLLLLWANRSTITGEPNKLPAWFFGLTLGQGISWYVLGLLAMIFGIVSLALIARRRTDRRLMRPALAGLVLGVAQVAATVVGFILLLTTFVSNG